MVGKIEGKPKKFVKPACPQCNMVTRWTDKQGLVGLNTTHMSEEQVAQALEEQSVDYEIIDITVDSEAYKFVVYDLGYTAAPVLWDPVSNDSFYGFDPNSLPKMFSVSV